MELDSLTSEPRRGQPCFGSLRGSAWAGDTRYRRLHMYRFPLTESHFQQGDRGALRALWRAFNLSSFIGPATSVGCIAMETVVTDVTGEREQAGVVMVTRGRIPWENIWEHKNICMFLFWKPGMYIEHNNMRYELHMFATWYVLYKSRWRLSLASCRAEICFASHFKACPTTRASGRGNQTRVTSVVMVMERTRGVLLSRLGVDRGDGGCSRVCMTGFPPGKATGTFFLWPWKCAPWSYSTVLYSTWTVFCVQLAKINDSAPDSHPFHQAKVKPQWFPVQWHRHWPWEPVLIYASLYPCMVKSCIDWNYY